MALSLSRLGISSDDALRHSHASRSSGFVGAETFTLLTALQQAVEGLFSFKVRKGKHVISESFAFKQLKPFTGFMAPTMRSNTTVKQKTDADTLFIFTLCFTSMIHFYF